MEGALWHASFPGHLYLCAVLSSLMPGGPFLIAKGQNIFLCLCSSTEGHWMQISVWASLKRTKWCFGKNMHLPVDDI